MKPEQILKTGRSGCVTGFFGIVDPVDGLPRGDGSWEDWNKMIAQIPNLLRCLYFEFLFGQGIVIQIWVSLVVEEHYDLGWNLTIYDKQKTQFPNYGILQAVGSLEVIILKDEVQSNPTFS